MASGSGTSGVAGGAGKYDEKKHKRDDSGQFSSTGGGGGGNGGGAEKPKKPKSLLRKSQLIHRSLKAKTIRDGSPQPRKSQERRL